MSSSLDANNRTKNILILSEDITQGLNHTTLTVKKEHSINFTEHNEKFCLSLHYNGDNSYLFVNVIEIIKFKARNSEIVAHPLCLGNISKDFSIDNMLRAGLNRYVYNFSVDYNTITVNGILDIHKYLMMFRFITKCFYLFSLVHKKDNIPVKFNPNPETTIH